MQKNKGKQRFFAILFLFILPSMSITPSEVFAVEADESVFNSQIEESGENLNNNNSETEKNNPDPFAELAELVKNFQESSTDDLEQNQTEKTFTQSVESDSINLSSDSLEKNVLTLKDPSLELAPGQNQDLVIPQAETETAADENLKSPILPAVVNEITTASSASANVGTTSELSELVTTTTSEDSIIPQEEFNTKSVALKNFNLIFSNTTDKILTLQRKPSGEILNFGLNGIEQKLKASVSENQANYEDVFVNTNFNYRFSETELKESIILKQTGHPDEFNFSINLQDYDSEMNADGSIALYSLGHKGEKFFRKFLLATPFMTDSLGQRNNNIKYEIAGNVLRLVLDTDWLKTANYPVIIDPTVEIEVLNIHSHPVEGELWNVDFTTLGVADLTITPADLATIQDDDFVSLTCGAKDLTGQAQILSGDVIYFPNWSCDEVARVSHLTLKTGNHHLIFNFGGVTAEAFNAAYTWDGGGADANWTTPANWSSDTLPGSSDTVTFDNTCLSNCSPTINTTTSISGLTISSTYAGILSQGAGYTLTVGSSGFNQAAGTFNGSTGGLAVSGNFILTGGTFNAPTTTTFSNNASTQTVNVNGSRNFYNVVFNNVSGTKNIVSTSTIVVLGDLTLTDGTVNTGTIDLRGNATQASTFDGGSAVITFGNDSLAQTYTLNGGTGLQINLDSAADAADSIVVNAASSVIGALNVTSGFSGTVPISNVSNYDFTIGNSSFSNSYTQAAGTFNGGSYNLNIRSAMTITGGVFNAPTTTTFTCGGCGGTHNLNFNGSLNFNNVEINANSTIKSIVSTSTMVVLGNLTLTDGTLNSTNPVSVYGNITQAAGLDSGSTAIIDFADNSLAQTYTVNGGSGPQLRFDSAADANDSLILSAASSTLGALIVTSSFSGTVPISNPSNNDFTLYGTNVNNTAFSLAAGIFNGGAYNLRIGTGMLISGGSFNAPTTTTFTCGNTCGGTHNISVGTTTFNNLSVNAANTIIGLASTSTLVALGTLSLVDGSVTAGVIEARGNATVASTLETGSTTHLKFTGSTASGLSAQTFDLTGASALYDGDITINKSDGQVTLLSALVLNASNQDLIVAAGTLDLSGNNLASTGTSGTLLVQNGGNLQLQGGETITANSGYPQLQSGSTVTYDGSGNYSLKDYIYQNLTLAGVGTFTASSATTTIFGNFSHNSGTFSHNSGTVNLSGGNQTIYGSSTFNNLIKSTSTAYTLTFASGTTQTIVGTLTLQGASGQRLSLRSDATGAQWKIDPQGTRTIGFLDVKDSNNINATAISAGGTNSINSGNNTNWDFGTTYTQNQYRWYQNLDALQPTTALAALNSTSTITGTSTAVRLRMNLTIASVSLATSSQAFVLQFATSTIGAWTTVGSGQSWQFYNNALVANTTTLSSNLLSASDWSGYYMESNPTGPNPFFVGTGENVEWDFALIPALASSTNYYFRLIRSDGIVLGAYSNYPALIINSNSTPDAPSSLGPVNMVGGFYTSSTAPSLNFLMSDPDISDTLKHRIQISSSSAFSTLAVDYISALASQGSQSFTVGQAAGSGSYNTGFFGQTLPDAAYYWRVWAIDNSNSTSSTSTANAGGVGFVVDATPPIAGNLSFGAVSSNSIDVSISGSSDSGSGLATSSFVFTNLTTGVTSATTSVTSWTSSGLSASTNYTFQALVIDAVGNIATTTQVSQTTSANGTNNSGGGGGGGALPIPTNFSTTTPLTSTTTLPAIPSIPVNQEIKNAKLNLQISADKQTWSKHLNLNLPLPEYFLRVSLTGLAKKSTDVKITCGQNLQDENIFVKNDAWTLIASSCQYKKIGSYAITASGAWESQELKSSVILNILDLSTVTSTESSVFPPALPPMQNNTQAEIPKPTSPVFLPKQISGLVKFDFVPLNIFIPSKLVNAVTGLKQPSALMLVALAPVVTALDYSVVSYGFIFKAGSFAEAWLYLMNYLQSLFVFLGLRKKRRFWGTVYDSQSKQPLDPVILKLVDAQTGKVCQQAISDLFGRFGFLDKPGSYRINALKTHYAFPSALINSNQDGLFENLYHGEILEISENAPLLAPNIPMDPLEFDWNQERKQSLVKFHVRLELLAHYFLTTLFYASFVYGIVAAFINPSIFNFAMLVLYGVLFILRQVIPLRHLWGVLYVKGAQTEGLYLELSPAAVPSVVVAKALTDSSGRFFLKANPGSYWLNIKRPVANQLVELQKIKIKIGRLGVLNQNIKL